MDIPITVMLKSPDNLKVQVPGQVMQERDVKEKSMSDGKLKLS